MTQSELFQPATAEPRRCAWCLVMPATTQAHAIQSCQSCAEADARTRVKRWMDAVQGGRR